MSESKEFLFSTIDGVFNIWPQAKTGYHEYSSEFSTMSFGSSKPVPSGATVRLTSQARVAFRPTSLIVGSPDKFTVDDIAVGEDGETDRKSTRLNSSHIPLSRMPSSA